MSTLHLLDNAPLVGFYALGLVAIFASLRVVMLANPVHAILSMIVSLLAIAGIFFILGAPFAGALQVIVYAGAILVLFVFVIMMLNLGRANDDQESRWLASKVWAVPLGLTVIIAIVLYAMIAMDNANVPHATSLAQDVAVVGTGTVLPKAVGTALFTKYLLLVEVAALLLLAALVAAYHLGKRALDDENSSHSSQSLTTSNHDIKNNGEDNNKDMSNHLEHHNVHADAYIYEPVDVAKFNNVNSVDDVSDTIGKGRL